MKSKQYKKCKRLSRESDRFLTHIDLLNSSILSRKKLVEKYKFFIKVNEKILRKETKKLTQKEFIDFGIKEGYINK